MRLSEDPDLGNPLPVQLEDTIPIVNQTRDPNLEHLHCILHSQARFHYNSPSAAYGEHRALPTRRVHLGAALQRLKALTRGPPWWTLHSIWHWLWPRGWGNHRSPWQHGDKWEWQKQKMLSRAICDWHVAAEPTPSSQNLDHICSKSNSLLLTEWMLPALIAVLEPHIWLSHRRQALRLGLNVYLGSRTSRSEGRRVKYPSCMFKRWRWSPHRNILPKHSLKANRKIKFLHHLQYG